jgi:hypothetical protein
MKKPTKNSDLTAVEWLFLMLDNPNKDQEFAHKLLNKALELEKEQIVKAYKDGVTCLPFDDKDVGEQYYDYIYKTKKS